MQLNLGKRENPEKNPKIPIVDHNCPSGTWAARQVTYVKSLWRRWSAFDVGEATQEGFQNEQSLILQPFRRRFTYVTAHSPILPASLYLRHLRHLESLPCSGDTEIRTRDSSRVRRVVLHSYAEKANRTYFREVNVSEMRSSNNNTRDIC